ncbi:hypothetical protein [Streptomyces violarus]|uniref:Uncharacterized protein n=1 Tax=Streptomyces violarus TaxID=67380 RepID=A0A7W4ZRI9_9ACTN|nr:MULTISPECIES: hypothetical protein [Streptomyces]MBB3077379.1 hypothetical protein [Streptomyces violarus]WRU00994.1 hypothetical protein VJ737_26420 [Streptomyces sp. CGMCC 4.1772]
MRTTAALPAHRWACRRCSLADVRTVLDYHLTRIFPTEAAPPGSGQRPSAAEPRH